VLGYEELLDIFLQLLDQSPVLDLLCLLLVGFFRSGDILKVLARLLPYGFLELPLRTG
jgi:hypothetical protein